MICTVKDLQIYYEEHGTGTPVLCIHGFHSSHHAMTGCLEPIFTQLEGYRRIYLDLPGMGQSSSAPWLMDADTMLSVLRAFIDIVLPDQTFLLAGASYGGYLARGLLYTMPERIAGALLLFPPVTARMADRILPEKCVLETSDLLDSSAPGLNAFLNMAVIATPETYERYRQDILPGIQAADPAFTAGYKAEGYCLTFEDEMASALFQKPVSILTGRQDHIVGYIQAFELLTQFPRATYAVLDRCGHLLQIENVPLFNQHVLDWLRRVGFQ